MKKWIFATLMTAAMFATSTGSGNAQPGFSAVPGAGADETGTCSYTCSANGRTYINRTQCQAACAGSGVCVVEAC